jgi:hypothetical protein
MNLQRNVILCAEIRGKSFTCETSQRSPPQETKIENSAWKKKKKEVGLSRNFGIF